MFSNIRQHYQVMKYHSKVPKKHFWMMRSAKNEAFGHYLEFGLLDWLDIAYDDRAICFPPFGNTTRSWRIIQKSQKSIFEWSEVPKMRFLAIILSLVCWIDLILHMMIELYIFHHLATLPGHEGSFQRFLFVLADLLQLWHSNMIHTAKPIIPSNHYAIQFSWAQFVFS